MSESRRLTMIVYAMGVLLVLAGLTGISRVALRLERNDREARAQAAFRETVQLALWRMESKLLPVINREFATPYFHYRPFYPAERAYTRMWEEVPPDAVLVPSPLLGDAGEFVRLHFEVDENGAFSSPQVPTGNMRDQAEAGDPAMSQRIVRAEETLGTLVSFLAPGSAPGAFDERLTLEPAPGGYDLDRLGDHLGQKFEFGAMKEIVPESDLAARQDVYEFAQRSNIRSQTAAAEPQLVQKDEQKDDAFLRKRAESSPPPPAAPAETLAKGKPAEQRAGEGAEAGDSAARSAQAEMTEEANAPIEDADARGFLDAVVEWSPARELGERAGDEIRGGARDAPSAPDAPDMPDVSSFSPVWRTGPARLGDDFGGQLLLLRTVRVGGAETTQGVWLDWPAIRTSLLQSVSDILPEATLQPVYPGSSVEGVPAGQRLASVPAVFLPGAQPDVASPLLTTTTGALAVTWLAVLAAIAAIGIVLRKSIELAERRGRFVTAVTHELRTPMTTFCLYTQMLADGMVRDDEDKKGYLETLKRESTRLAGIVENVLDYARLGESRSHTRAAPCDLRERLESVAPALRERARACGMTLDLALPEEPVDALADAKGLERILLNLVDNACKYAAGGERIDIDLVSGGVNSGVSGGRPRVRVRDHGPGIDPGDREKIFRPFRRAARDADNPNPGLGLGLALCRGLARAMGGELTVEPPETGQGAVFILELARPA